MSSEVSTVADDHSVEALRRELAEAREQQTATAQILASISSSVTDANQVFAEIAASAARLCDANDATIFKVDGDLLRRVANNASIPQYETRGDDTMPLTREVVGRRAVLDGKTIQVADVQAEMGEYPEGSQRARRVGHRTILAVPLMRVGEAIGVIAIRRTEVLPFTERQINLLKTFADQAVIAIENTRLFAPEQARKRELQESLEYQIAISEVLSVISQSPTDVQPVFDMIAQSAARLCRAQFGHVFRYDGTLIHFAAVHGLAPEGREALESLYPMPPGRATAAARSILTRTVEEIPDVRADSEYSVAHSLVIGFRSVAAVPMLMDGHPIGAVAVLRSETGRFPERQIQLLKTFADQAVIAIENARLFEAEQASKRELQESLEHQTATSDVLSVISRSPSDLQPVLNTLVASAARLCDAEMVAIHVRHDDAFPGRARYGVSRRRWWRR
jgi:two-component system, NtrC family, sensor kinase